MANAYMKTRFEATGHEDVQATHQSTLEVTTDDWLTPAGDCIVGIEAGLAPADLAEEFVAACQSTAATISLRLQAGGHETVVTGRGDPTLTFESERSMVCRTSEYVDDRTVLLEADMAAGDLDRAFVDYLADGAAISCTLSVE